MEPATATCSKVDGDDRDNNAAVAAVQALRTQPGRATLVVVETPFSARSLWGFMRNMQYMALCNYYANKTFGPTWVPQMCNTRFALFGLTGYVGDTLGALLLPWTPASYAAYDLDRDTTLEVTDRVRRSPRHIDAAVVFTDFGISQGMRSGMDAVRQAGKPVALVTLPPTLKRHILGESIPSTVVPLTLATCAVGPWMYGAWCLARKVFTRGRR